MYQFAVEVDRHFLFAGHGLIKARTTGQFTKSRVHACTAPSTGLAIAWSRIVTTAVVITESWCSLVMTTLLY